MAIKILKLDPNAISENEFSQHTHNYRKVTRIGVDESKAWTSPIWEPVIDEGDSVCVGLNDIEGAALTTAMAATDVPIYKWSGLTGFTAWYSHIPSYADTWLANGFDEGRDLRVYTNTAGVAASKVSMLEAIALGIKCIWGVTAGATITATNWVDYRAAIISAATWAQANGIYEFQIGNEDCPLVDGVTITVSQLIANFKDVAEDVQAIYTIGDVTYSCRNDYIASWVTAGKGNYIDQLASNIYMEYGDHYAEPWEDHIDALVDEFGVDGTYISEFAPNASSLDQYSTDEAVQAAGVTEMIDYIRASGIKRAMFYTWWGDQFGVVKDDESYRELWDSLLNSG